LNNKKITVGTTTKKKPSAIIAAATTIAPVLASAARVLGIQKQRLQQTNERKGIMNKKIYLYYLAGTMIAIAGILHLVVASHVLGGLDGIIHSLVGPGLLTATFSIAKLGFFFLVAGIAQLFWSIPMTKRWGRKWYYIGICGTIALIALYAATKGPNPITTGGINIPIYDIPTEIFQIVYVAIATIIIIVQRKQRSEVKLRGLLR
jgi:uncharacterized BrkB/YihY/UPF0761 family membrane protein